MADISMCDSWQCPSRFTCRRNEASGTKASKLQWWMAFDDERAGRNRCSSYWPIRERGGGAPGGEGKGEGVGDAG